MDGTRPEQDGQRVARGLSRVSDLTTEGQGAHEDAQALVYRPPRIVRPVPGYQWHGALGRAKAIVRVPLDWNGKLVIGATPAVRSEFALDHLVSDIVLQRGYAYAACDKATPGLTLRDGSRSMAEWEDAYVHLIEVVKRALALRFADPARTYVLGVSNGGYVARILAERHPHLFDGAVDWEGVHWDPDGSHLLRTLPPWIVGFAAYAQAEGAERARLQHHLVALGLPAGAERHWPTYYQMYWLVTLWLYGRNLDPDWPAFALPWSNEWLRDPSPLAAYPADARSAHWAARIFPIANTGAIGVPVLTVAGNWDCLLPFAHHQRAYAAKVAARGRAHLHRLYEIDRGNHVDGLLRLDRGDAQPVFPYFEAAFLHLERWIECGEEPPRAGLYRTVEEFARGASLYADTNLEV
ncbi:alpha/beta hydrolase family protein [Alicyclobacillus vulcanalis]|uniref:Prolyl oligopeptidase family protein n=1 Tax=Alicyclobacillus vulcanalis TaxID=252246 RepID=A0A1N7PP43_9BACL|nr:alpha/beta hydrolase [Alicyclobacillus vulcanalis]SIT12129.1 Prolyl oligopeptidase family protein [Alicyclobacillus vulcanalis]